MISVKRIVVTTVAAVAVLSAGSAATAEAAPPQLPPLPEPLATWLAPPKSAQQKLTESFAVLQKSMRTSDPGAIGVSLVPVGSDAPAISLGTVTTGRAWSTLKVPVSLAAERHLGGAVLAEETKAIRLSDNDSADYLWRTLGGGHASVDAVTAVLREGHDTRTQVSSQFDALPSFPGYTMWALADQARFGAHLPCMPGTAGLIGLMSSVAPNQQWGIAGLARSSRAITSTAVKGGWGPGTGTSSAFLVRQLGILTTSRGQVAISMAAVPKSNRFEDGTAMLTKAGNWLSRNLAAVPAGRCGVF